MFIVALCELAGPIEIEAQALAKDLGTTAYEERLALAAGVPSVVLTTADRELATKVARQMKSRKQVVVAFDAAAVVASDAMVSMRAFELTSDRLLAHDQAGGVTAELPYDDVLLVARAIHKTKTETVTETKKKEFSLGRAALSGGVMLTKTTKKTEKSTSNESGQVLYLFRRSGETPWLLRERGASFATLGAAMSPSSTQSFATTIERLRRSCPTAVYDERLAAPGALSGKAARLASISNAEQSTAPAIDLLAHALALWVRKRTAP